MIKNIYVYGDSISLQWGKHFSNQIDGKYRYERLGGGNSDDLANENYNGGSTRKMLKWAEQLREPYKNTLLVFNCGLHDIKRDFNGNIMVPVEEYILNLKKIIAIVKKYFTDLIWVSTTPVNNKRHLEYCKEFIRNNEDVIVYNQRASILMREENIAVVDLYSFTSRLVKESQNIYKDHVHMVAGVSEQQAAELKIKIEQYISRKEKKNEME